MAFSGVDQDNKNPRAYGGNDGSLPSSVINGHYNGALSSSGPIAASSPAVDHLHNSVAPIAICGMALRLPGGLESPQDLWEFLLAKGDARSRVPESRYNISAYHSDSGKSGTIATQYGYFLDDSVKLGSLDASRFSLSRAELEFSDPQQRRMLEVVREAFDDAGEINFKVRLRTIRKLIAKSLRLTRYPGPKYRLLYGKLW